jgi:hypothetical protein
MFTTDAPLAAQRSVRVKMNVEYEKKERHLLKVSITNEGDEFECPLSALPWTHYYSMTIIVSEQLTGTRGYTLKLQQFFDDPIPTPIKLKKDEMIEGTINLDQRYPTLAKCIAKEGLDLFWSYQLTDVNNNRSKRIGGWLFLPKD